MGPDASLIDAIAVTEPRKASLYFDIKRNTLDDGPGIRSVVFFKGCPLSCTWCQNPESINTGYELSYDAEKCISCHDCADACPEQAIDLSSPDKIIRDKCTQCFKCVDVCPSGALERCGNDIDMDHLVEKVLEDEAFFEASGGGVTVSGGEALMQMDSVGSQFAGHLENTKNIDDIQIYGMSSSTAMNKYNGGVAEYRSSEGRTASIEYRGDLENTIKYYLGGLRSGMTYIGAGTVKDIPKRATFIKVSNILNELHSKDTITIR